MDDDLPKTARDIKQILQSMGVEEYEPRVVNQLVDFTYQYVATVVQNAETYAQLCGKPAGTADMDNVMTAIQAHAALSFVQAPATDQLYNVASYINKEPLPEPKARQFGLRLPEDDLESLLAQNFQYEPPPPQTGPEDKPAEKE